MLELLAQYILPQYQEPQRPHKPFARHTLRLEENAPQAMCRLVLLETQRRALVYKFDKGSGPNHPQSIHQRKLPFMVAMPGVEQMCDFVIFLDDGPHRTYVVLANLKSTKAGNNENQLRAGELFTDFITQTILRCQNMHPDDHHFVFRRILFMSSNIPKGRTKPSPLLHNDHYVLPCGVPINLDVYC
jgi:hypothetical protein